MKRKRYMKDEAYQEVAHALALTHYREWVFGLERPSTNAAAIYAVFDCEDAYGGEHGPQSTRKWLIDLSEYTGTNGQAFRESVAHTAFLCVMQAEEHEVREFFMFNGQRPFDPHKRVLS